MQPKYVVFDTETTGLFKYKDPVSGAPIPADDPSQPRMASYAAILTDESGREIERYKYFVKPNGWSIDGTYAADVNGLTDKFLNENGVPIATVLDHWAALILQGLIVTAFNAQFDCKMMRPELRRAGRDDLFDQTKNICLMRSLAPYKNEGLRINRGMVKLAVACEFFGIVNANAHDAMADAEAARAILEKLISDRRLLEPKVHLAKVAAS